MPKCKKCKEKFDPKFFNQKYCTKDQCVKAYVESFKEKEWKKRKKVLKEKVKTLGDYKAELQTIFNACIREIDSGYNCISCGAINPSDAGHYRSRGAYPELRFDPFNVHLECRSCNGYKGGKPIEYREGLIDRYGKETTEAFLDPSPPLPKLTIQDIKELKKVVRNFLKWLRQEDKHYSIEETIQLRQELLENMKQSLL